MEVSNYRRYTVRPNATVTSTSQLYTRFARTQCWMFDVFAFFSSNSAYSLMMYVAQLSACWCVRRFAKHSMLKQHPGTLEERRKKLISPKDADSGSCMTMMMTMMTSLYRASARRARYCYTNYYRIDYAPDLTALAVFSRNALYKSTFYLLTYLLTYQFRPSDAGIVSKRL